jgi:hypothetical protein
VPRRNKWVLKQRENGRLRSNKSVMRPNQEAAISKDKQGAQPTTPADQKPKERVDGTQSSTSDTNAQGDAYAEGNRFAGLRVMSASCRAQPIWTSSTVR